MDILKSSWGILCEMAPYILLGFFIAGLLQVFVDRRTMARHLAGRGWKPVVKAALFGIPLPLCSCGVLPTAVALRRRGASKGATTSFLIATPQTGVDSIAATYSLLGLPFAIIRPLAALVGATFGGMAVEYFDTENASSEIADAADDEPEVKGFWRKLLASVRYGFIDMVASVGGWLVIGLIVAALITVYVPDELFVSLNRYPIVAMLAVVAVAVPMYVCATGSIPIALSLMMKGLSPGIAFVMLMAGPAANFASIVILSKTQGSKATFIYVLSVVLTALAFGLTIDLLLPREWFAVDMIGGNIHGESAPGWFPTVCALVLAALLVYTQILNRTHHHSHHKIGTSMTQEFKVTGMNCPHCQASVNKAISGVEGVEQVEVDLKGAKATVTGNVDSAAIIAAVELAGFECTKA